MKSYHANSGAGLAGLTLREHDEPKPGPREALIRMKANSLNFRELMVLRGNYPLPVTFSNGNVLLSYKSMES